MHYNLLHSAQHSIFVGCLMFILPIGLFAQSVVNISDGGVVNDMTCSEQITLTDSGGASGNYGPGESHTITLCVVSGAETSSQFVISPALFGHTWDIDANSSLFLYDGPNATPANLQGEFNSVSHPSGIFYTATGNCITLTFVSGPGSSGAGFTSTFQCLQPLQPFELDVTGEPSISPWGDLPNPSMRICFEETITASAITNYPLSDAGGNGYLQNDSTTLFRWVMGDGTTYQGFNLTTIEHTYANPLGYLVSLFATDASGRQEFIQFFVLIAPRPDFSNVAIDDSLCIDTQTAISGGEFNGEFVGVSPSQSAILGGGEFGQPLFLPDGNNTNYEVTIEITDFEEGQLIENVSDIISLCLNIEHSFLGDLEMTLTCPNGTEVAMFNTFFGTGMLPPGDCSGGGTFLGDANDVGAPGVPGIGFDYCFAPDAEWGTFCQELAAGNTVPVNTFNNGNAMAPGTYSIDGDWEDFVGCPLNGEWTLTVRDNLFSDDGWIFSWAVYFNPNIDPTAIFYSPIITEVYWEENQDIVSNDGASIVVQPSQEGDNAFTFVAIDEFECIHDTTIFIYVRPHIEVFDDIACDLTHELIAANAVGGGSWELLTGPTANSTALFDTLDFGFANVEVNDYGLYEFELTDFNCAYKDTAIIDFRPDPQIQAFITDTTLCNNASIIFDAGPQFPNAENFQIFWTLDGQLLDFSGYAYEANQTGQYILEIVGHCSTASDTSDVVAIKIEVEGDTICGLINPGVQAAITPPGDGIWTTANDNITFSNPNGLVTSITSSAYGSFEVFFADSRCPNDAESRFFRFVQQPAIAVTPANPDFCVDLDSLVLSTTVSGNNTGTYTWSVNGAPQQVTEGTVTFPAMTFEPLENVDVEVRVVDNFGVCQVASASSIFNGKWCTYNIPNIISPNGDGRNDTWDIEFIEFFPSTNLRVYNRWGNIVFEQENYDQFQNSRSGRGWDPEGLSEGSYFYELSLPQLRKVETGNLTIVRGVRPQ